MADSCPGPLPGGQVAVTTNGAPTLSGEYSWIVDRYPADVFEQVTGETYGKAGAIHMLLGPCGYYDRADGGRADPLVQQQSYFYDAQGSKTLPGIVPGTAIVSTELFLPQGWDSTNGFTETAAPNYNYVGNFQEPSLMLTLAGGDGVPVIYPVVAFLNRSNAADPPRVRIYDYTNAQWVTADVDIDFGDWNKIEVRFDKDTDGDFILEYRINGETVFIENVQDFLGAAASDPTLGLREVILHSENNNSSPYDVYWHNTYAANLLGPGDSLSGAKTGHLVLVDGSTLLDNAAITGYLVLFDGSSISGAGTFTGGGVVKAGSILGGNISIAGNLTNLSGIIAPGNSPGIISIGGNYIGSLAGPDDTIPAGVFEVDLSATTPVAGTDYDQFNVGGTAAGVTAITLTDLSLAGSAIGDLDDIRLIRIGDITPDPSGAFVQANRVVKNAHDILIVYGTEADAYPGYFGLEAVVVAETKALAAVPALGAFAAEQLIGTYVDRHGLDWSGGQPVWGRAVATGFDFGTDTGASSTGALGGLQAGFDIATPAEGWRVGLTASWGTLSADLADNAGSANVTNAAAGLYVTYVNEGGFYADLLLQFRGLWAELSTPGTSSFSVDGHSVDIAAEAGYRFYPWEGLTVVPFAQLLYQGQSLGGYDDGTFSATFDPADTTGRLGVLVEAETGWGTVFGSAALIADLDGKQQTVVSSFPMVADAGDLQVQVSGGVEAALSPAADLALSGYYRVGLGESVSAFGLNASLRVAF